jgi:hypothetical protein
LTKAPGLAGLWPQFVVPACFIPVALIRFGKAVTQTQV